MTDVNDIVRLGGQHQEILKRVANGSLNTQVVREAYQQIIEGRFALADPFAYLSQYLLPLDEQLERAIHSIKKHVGGGYFTKRQFRVDTEPRQEQSVTDLEILHVEGRRPGETVDLLWAAIAATQPNAYRTEHLQADKIRLFHQTLVRAYAPGIHRVRINLTANWSGQRRNVEEVRAQAAAGQLAGQLAHGETLSAFAWMPDLVPQMDGKKFPFMDLAGYNWVDGSNVKTLCFWWNSYVRSARISVRAELRDTVSAAPVVLWES